MAESITADMLATQPLRELEFTVLPQTELGLLPRVLLLPYGASAVGFAPGGELGTVVVYRVTGMPGVTRWLVNGDTLARDLEATRSAPGVPVDVFVAAQGGDLDARLSMLAAELMAVSRMVQRLAWRTPPGLGQTSMHHNHRLGLVADRVMSSDVGKPDISWLGLVGPLTHNGLYRVVGTSAMRDPGDHSRRRLVASFRDEIKTREP